MMTNDNELRRAVVRVGDGRGFVVDLGRERVIITAAHCLPWKKLPAPHLARYLHDIPPPPLLSSRVGFFTFIHDAHRPSL